MTSLPWHEGSKVFVAGRVRAGWDGSQSSTPKVFSAEYGPGLVLRDLLDEIAPFAGQLVGRLATFDTYRQFRQRFTRALLIKKFGTKKSQGQNKAM
jgi:hypothetical protein